MSRAVSLLALGAAAWLAVAVDMAPVGGALSGWAGPDMLLCVVALWAVRRPAQTPAIIVFLLGVARDLLSGGPVGAGALGLLVAAEALRGRGRAASRGGFPAEWLAVGLAAATALGVQWALLTATLAPTPATVDLIARLSATVAAYPVVALALRWAVRLGPAPTPAEGATVLSGRARAAQRAAQRAMS